MLKDQCYNSLVQIFRICISQIIGSSLQLLSTLWKVSVAPLSNHRTWLPILALIPISLENKLTLNGPVAMLTNPTQTLWYTKFYIRNYFMEFNWLFFLPVHWDSKNSATKGSLKRETGAGMKSPPQSAPLPLPMGSPDRLTVTWLLHHSGRHSGKPEATATCRWPWNRKGSSPSQITY